MSGKRDVELFNQLTENERKILRETALDHLQKAESRKFSNENYITADGIRPRLFGVKSGYITAILSIFLLSLFPVAFAVWLLASELGGELYHRITAFPLIAYIAMGGQSILAVYCLFWWRKLDANMKLLATANIFGIICDIVSASIFFAGFRTPFVGDFFMLFHTLIVLLLFYQFHRNRTLYLALAFLHLTSFLFGDPAMSLYSSLMFVIISIYDLAITDFDLSEARTYMDFGVITYFLGIGFTALYYVSPVDVIKKLMFAKSASILIAYVFWAIAISFASIKFRAWIDKLFASVE